VVELEEEEESKQINKFQLYGPLRLVGMCFASCYGLRPLIALFMAISITIIKMPREGVGGELFRGEFIALRGDN
jgi:hypothetical protein